jgi:hypothetical protein
MRFPVVFAALSTLLLVQNQSCAAGQTRAAPPSFEFRGHHIGEPIQQSFPKWNQEPAELTAPGCMNTGPSIECDDPTVGFFSVGLAMFRFITENISSPINTCLEL